MSRKYLLIVQWTCIDCKGEGEVHIPVEATCDQTWAEVTTDHDQKNPKCGGRRRLYTKSESGRFLPVD